MAPFLTAILHLQNLTDNFFIQIVAHKHPSLTLVLPNHQTSKQMQSIYSSDYLKQMFSFLLQE
jgi:hypothetical protein